MPQDIVSDRDAKFTNKAWKDFCKTFNIHQSMSTAYHPRTDRQSEVQSRGVHWSGIHFWSGVRMLTQHYSSGYYCMNLLSNLVSALEVIQPNTLYKMQVIDMGTRHYNSWGTIFSIILLNKPPTPTSTPLPNATKKYILTEVYSRLFPPSKTNRDEQFLSLGKYLRNCESSYCCGQAQFSNFHGK